MRKFLLLIALMVSGFGIVSAQNVGDYITKSYSGYSLKFTVTSVSPAECEVVCSTKPTSNKSITIPSSVTIKSKTFNVTSVGKEGFSSCDYITSVKLPNTLTIICNLAFYKCKGLSSINLPENLTSIGSAAFMYCNKITSVVIPEGVKVINYQTFSDCSTLKTVKLSSNCTKIDNDAFRYCFALENIEIPNGVTYIGSYSFYGAAFTKVIIPHSVTTLGDFAFSGCSKLTELTIGNGVKTIDRNVIETYNSPLAKLTIGCSVTNIGLNLGNCYELIEIHSLALQPPTLGYSLNKNTKVYVPYDCYYKYKNATYWKDCTIVEGAAIGQLPVGAKLMSDNICYEVIVEGKEVSVTSLSSGKYTGDVVIPTTIIHSDITYGVTEIGKAAFYDCSNLTSIEIPNSIKEIVGADNYYEGAFSTCPNLKTVTFAENSQLAHIGSCAFYGCSNLTSINIPNNVTRIEGAAFTKCAKLKSVTFEEDSKLAFIQGFSYNTSLTSIEIPASVTELGANAFNGCTNLQSVKFGEDSQLTTIGDHAFYDCNKINTITFNTLTPPSVGSYSFTNYNAFLNVPEESILTYRNDDFWGKFNYNNVHLINDIYYTTINDNAIVTYKNKSYGNYSGDVVIPNTITINGINYNVTYIDEHAFDGCSNLTSVVIPNSIKSIADYVFYNCSKLATVTFEDDSQLETIGDYAFYKCSVLTSIGIPNSVTKIGASAFEYCKKVENVGFEEDSQLKTIGERAFLGCSQLTSINIPSNVNSIGNFAFSVCSELTNIEIPDEVVELGVGMFDNCSKLASITFGENSQLENIGSYMFYNCSCLTSINIPKGVVSIGDYAFYGCTSLKSVKCNAIDVPKMGGSNVFSGSGICSIQVPEESIESYKAVSPWNEYTIIKINSYPYIVGDALVVNYDNYSLKFVAKEDYECIVTCSTKPTTPTAITIPSEIQIGGSNLSVTSIGEYAFYNCSLCTRIDIPDVVNFIGERAFHNCSSCIRIDIPEYVDFIGGYAFYNCSGLLSVNIPDRVSSIYVATFYNCSSLTSVYIPSEVVSIDNAAFSGCTNLKEIICFNITPATITNNVFSGIMSDAKIYVPSVSLYNYKNKWSSYSSKIVGMPTYTENGWSTKPTAEDNVAVNYPLVISGNSRANDILTVNTIGICNNGSLTIKDGGQLVCNKVSGNITVEKEIEGYANQEGNSWHTIASPLKGETDLSASSVSNIFNNQYDLYRYDEPTYTWQNYKNSANNGFTNLESGRGYLYANSEDVTLSFTGNINTNEVSYNLTKDGEMLNGFHLIGNPFTHNIKLENNNQIAQGYYALSNEGAWGVQLGFDEPVKPCQGVLVKALEEGTLVIKNEMPQASRSQQSTDNGQQSLGITVANDKYSDKAFVVFGKGAGIDKINHQNENIPMLYIPVDGVDYAIAAMDKNFNEIPVSFEAMTMGEYTISLRQDNCEFEELYLLDKETNTTVNILAEDYTFIATSNENPERFMLLKKANGQQPTVNSHFAYVNNGDIVIYDIEGNGDIQIFDAMGRCVYNGNCCTDAIHRVPMGGFSTGVYMIQKADESGVKVQKIIL